jgi:LCP family protein required for cell wall assembly
LSTKRKPPASIRETNLHRQPLAPLSWKIPSLPALHLPSSNSLPHIPLPRVKVRIPYKLLAPFICLFTIVGLLISGIYYVEINFLQPLGELFHPVSGLDNSGAIDGRAWNLLLLGSDTDNKYTFPSVLTQVMIVARIDPYKESVSLVSIPRDSWVPVPGSANMHKIDQAFFLGAVVHNNFDDGVRSAQATIFQDYGISVDRYAWVGLGGFASIINTLGGVDLDLTHPVLDDAYPNDTGKGSNSHDPYALKRLDLAPGPQHLDGNTALEYVRSRHADLIGDIGRTQRQQEVLEAMKKRLTLPAIFNHLSALAHDLDGQVYTDLSQGELLSLANFARDLPTPDVHRLTLGPGKGKKQYGSYAKVYDPTAEAQQDVVVPNCANIQPVINRIFDLTYNENCRSSQG